MKRGRSSAALRLVRAWDDADGGRPSRVVTAIARGYRGLIETREWLYARGVLRSKRLPCPVISVGNLTVGGTGKTPGVELAARTLADLGYRPAVVSRGYGRRTRGIQVVADATSIRLDPEDAGDEPFLLARRLPGVPVVVGSNRREGGRVAIDRFGVTAIVLDDGFQQRTLSKDLEIVMARARNPWGNGRLLPAGPLREPLDALGRAHLVIVVGARECGDARDVASAVSTHAPGVPVLAARYVPIECWDMGARRAVSLATLSGARLIAFAGIGSPPTFERTLTDLGVHVESLIVFADHHWYSRGDLARLHGRVAAAGARGLVTTEKDWVRLRRLPPPDVPLYVVSVRLELLGGMAAWRGAFERACRNE